MRVYYFVVIGSTLLFILSACKPEELAQIEGNYHACYLENSNTGQRFCVEANSSITSEEEVSSICESLGNDSTGFVYEPGKCATNSAVTGSCRGSYGIDISTTLYFYYPEFNEDSAEEYCDSIGAPYSWNQDGTVVLGQSLHAEEALPENLSLEDLMNDKIIKFSEN